MRLARLGPAGAEMPVCVTDDASYDLRGLTTDFDGRFFASDGITRVRRAAAARELPELPDAAAMRSGPPLARPSAVVCVGMNYAAHAE